MKFSLDGNREDYSGKFDINSSKPLFVMDTPPPYPSGRPWHIGGASHYAQIDMIARSARMRGFEVLFPIGIDQNGLPVEIYTEKKYKVSIKSTPREKFLDSVRIALDDLEQEMLQTLKSMGYSGNYERNTAPTIFLIARSHNRHSSPSGKTAESMKERVPPIIAWIVEQQ